MVKSGKVSDIIFRRRAIAKFRLYLGVNSDFWKHNELKDQPLNEAELYSDKGDKSDLLATICKEIKKSMESIMLGVSSDTDIIVSFFNLWRLIY